MRQSWSTTLFLQINARVGKWTLLDRLLIFCAHYLVGVLLLVLLISWIREGTIFFESIRLAVEIIAAMSISYMFAFLWKHPRPIMQLPNIRVLIRTLGTWKSFPSDHTIVATIFAYSALGTFSPLPLSLFVLACISVAFARIWVGVHYPRDIVGGFLVASSVLGLMAYSLG